ncbi:interleukin-18-binding protein [Pseudophryne corroboree]|uniref:interleukin-18-binding protein n=1 Tax=Pseudophryne corroboree TaxID=495146 RepID=UPI003082070C
MCTVTYKVKVVTHRRQRDIKVPGRACHRDTMTQSTAPGEKRAGGIYLLSLLIMNSVISTTAASHLPKILYPEDSTVTTKKGDSCRILCTAETRWPRFHVVYWLVNNSFIEDAYPDGRVREQAESLRKDEMPCYVEKPLEFTSTQPEDFTRTFTCVIQDPSGVDVKHFSLMALVGLESGLQPGNWSETREEQKR